MYLWHVSRIQASSLPADSETMLSDPLLIKTKTRDVDRIVFELPIEVWGLLGIPFEL